jgi:hypothetical protein
MGRQQVVVDGDRYALVADFSQDLDGLPTIVIRQAIRVVTQLHSIRSNKAPVRSVESGGRPPFPNPRATE